MALPYTTKPRQGRGPRIALILLGGVATLFLLFCSGLQFPLLAPRKTLASSLKDELGIALPASVVVERSARVAYRDPSIFYLLTLNPADADALSDALAAADQGKTLLSIPGPGFFVLPTAGAPPSWWTPSAIPGMRRYDATTSDHQNAFTIFHVPGSKTVFLFWCEF